MLSVFMLGLLTPPAVCQVTYCPFPFQSFVFPLFCSFFAIQYPALFTHTFLAISYGLFLRFSRIRLCSCLLTRFVWISWIRHCPPPTYFLMPIPDWRKNVDGRIFTAPPGRWRVIFNLGFRTLANLWYGNGGRSFLDALTVVVVVVFVSISTSTKQSIVNGIVWCLRVSGYHSVTVVDPGNAPIHRIILVDRSQEVNAFPQALFSPSLPSSMYSTCVDAYLRPDPPNTTWMRRSPYSRVNWSIKRLPEKSTWSTEIEHHRKSYSGSLFSGFSALLTPSWYL